ncbi:MAG: hypothetical protein VB122_02305 [Erysipelotrichales bacterium]|uniref:hypothetical protein n=1 Tax=Anaerotignum propionicum TaxID=28446 RepID=UPI002B1FDF05|nr:hypothetical protein [Anaerotignum propionicum]MEA4821058.1 hypothetical protein [Erysipelotrichales bacterium]MEA5057047.1 hypothetical protein [Anaerotignum propionicum]
MANIKKFRDNEKKRRLIEKILASFLVTATVVVTIVIANQKPVTADFLNVEALGNEIVYRVDVQDPDQRIAEKTLQLEIKGNTEKYYSSLSIGESQGSQIVFGSSTSYTLNIMADLGFGREILDTETIKITNSLAGAILDVRLDQETIPAEEPETLTYLIDTKYYDPEAKVESAFLEYAYVYEEEEYPPMQQIDPNNLEYNSIIIEGQTATTILESISNYNVTIHLRLVVNLIGEENSTILDEREFSTPFRFFGSIYADDVGMDYALFSVYSDYPQDVTVAMFVDVYFQSDLLTSLSVTSDGDSDQYEGAKIRVENLIPNTPYFAILRAIFVSPDTGQEKIVTQEPVTFTTSQMYQWEITSFVDNGASFDIVVTTQDPFNIIQSVSCVIFGLDENRNIVNYYYYTLTMEIIEPMEIYSATINKPTELFYDLELSLSKQIGQAYYSEIIYTLSV